MAVLAHDLVDMQKQVSGAQHTAERALADIAAHERICSERYANINKGLENIPKIYEAIGRVQKVVYIGVGIWVGLPVIIGGFFGLFKLIMMVKGIPL